MRKERYSTVYVLHFGFSENLLGLDDTLTRRARIGFVDYKSDKDARKSTVF